MRKNEIRTNWPADNLFGNQITVDPPTSKVVITFFGEQHGVRLVWRGMNDPHIIFEILSEDDGHWYPSGGSASSSWLPGLIKVMRVANKWMINNCEPDMYNGRQYGWKDKNNGALHKKS